MTTTSKLEGKKLFTSVAGRLDTTTAPELEAELTKYPETEALELDFTELEYISSAGLRVLLSQQKRLGKLGGMTVKNVNSSIMEVFEITGFADILTIE